MPLEYTETALTMFVSTRTTFLKAAAAGLAAPCAFAQTAKITTTQVGDGICLLSGAGGNVIARTGTEGAVLVDGGLAENADALAQAVAALPNGSGKIHTLFNTHWHPEQTGSNEKLGMAGATIIAQENTRLWLQQNITWPWNGQKFKKLAKIAQPNKPFYDKGALDAGIGSSEIRYGYISDAAHTDGDLYVYFPQQNVLAVGDAAYGQGWPVVDWWTGGWTGGDVRRVQRLATVAHNGQN